MPGKLAVGVYKALDELIDDLTQSNARIGFLGPDALGYAARVKQRAPGMEIIGRRWWSVVDQVTLVLSPTAKQDGYNTAVALCQSHPLIDVWQGLNEVADPKKPELLEGQIVWETGFADGCQAMGRRCIVLNFAPGTYPTNDWEDTSRARWPWFAETVRPLLKHPAVKYLGIHIYSHASRTFLTVNPKFYALRYRLLAQSFRDSGIYCPPIVVTELGQGDGWRDWTSKEQVLRDFEWLVSTSMTDTYLAAWVPFLFGDCGGWANYDCHGMGPDIATFNRLNPAPAITDTSAEVQHLPEYTLGFKAYHDAHPEIGAAVSDLLYDANGTAVQYTEQGKLEWCKQANQVYFFQTSPKA